MITGATGPFQGARAALVSFAIGIGCCVLATELVLADTAPCFNKVRPTEQLVLATSADDPNRIFKYVDDGTSVNPKPTLLGTAASGTAYRGISMAP